MIDMPESYEKICRKMGILSGTMYNLPYKPEANTDWFEAADVALSDSYTKGTFYLYYVIRSFPRPTDSRRYNLLFVTKNGLFTSINSHSMLDEPVDFNNIYCKRLCDFGFKDMLTLKPGTREVIILKHYRFTELLDGKGVPNTWNWKDHKELWNQVRNHEIMVEADNFDEPIVCEFRPQMYAALKRGMPYLHLREDNYVPIESVRFMNDLY